MPEPIIFQVYDAQTVLETFSGMKEPFPMSLEQKIQVASKLPELTSHQEIVDWLENTPEGAYWERTSHSAVTYHALIEDHDMQRCDERKVITYQGHHYGCWDNSVTSWTPTKEGRWFSIVAPWSEGRIDGWAYSLHPGYSSDYAQQRAA